MNNNSFLVKISKVILILIVLVIATVITWKTFLGNRLPHDNYREGITIEEAQKLVSFPICKPSYIPQGTDSNPKIIYDSDDANVPETTYIRLRYQGTDSKNKVLEIYQRYTPDEGLNSNPNSEGAKVNLLYWMVPQPESSLPSIKTTLASIQVEANVFQTDQMAWWLYEIVDPSKYRSTMTTWIRDHVEYRVLSYLPAEEINKITLSMFECSTNH